MSVVTTKEADMDTKVHLRQHETDELFDTFDLEFNIEVRNLQAEYAKSAPLPGARTVAAAKELDRIFCVAAQARGLDEPK